MPSGNPNIAQAGEVTRWKAGESGNPSGKPKGTKHLSTYIQEILEDDDFSFFIKQDPKGKKIEYKGAPIKAIITVAVYRAMMGDKDAREWLAKYGYGSKDSIDIKVDVRHKILERFDLHARQIAETEDGTPS